MNLKKPFILIAFIAVLLTAFGFQTSPEFKVIFEKAKFTMETKGNLEEAIKLFNEIIEKYSDEREYAAKSQLYIGLCYEKLGLKEAQKAYQKVVDTYPEQTEAVKLANEKLSILLRAEAVIRKEDKEFSIRQVWAGPDVDIEGAPSPDGRYLSYMDRETGDLAIYEIATGKKRRLTNKGTWQESDEFALFSRWSPDSKNIAYSWFKKDGTYDLRIIWIDGSGLRILCSGYVEPTGWSPDGKHILANFYKSKETNKIVLVSVADGSMRVIKDLGIHSTAWGSFSPDGRYIVYNFQPKEDTPNHDISLLSTDGSSEISLVKHPAHEFVLGWTPDGKNILFASDRTGTFDAWVIHLSEGKPQGVPELIKKGIGKIWPMGFTQKGSFYYGISQDKWDVYIATLDPNTGKILAQPKKEIKRFEGSNNSPDYSPDGKYLAYVSVRGTKTFISGLPNVLCIRSLENGEERELFPELKGIILPRWSPDGRTILLFGMDKKDRSGIYQIDAQTGEVKPIVQNMLIKYYSWTLSGKAVFYTIKDPNNKLSCIIMRNLDTGEEKELYRQSSPTSMSGLALSHDGSWLAFVEGNKILKVMPAAGGETRNLFELKKAESIRGRGIAWTPDGLHILFVKGWPRGELWRISAKDGEPQKLGLEMIRLRYLSVHPDGQHIAFSSLGSTTKIQEIWVMENFLPEIKAEQ